jgi:hypothetical protein
MSSTLIAVTIVFLLGLYFVATVPPSYEAFIGGKQCPNQLIQKGDKYYLYNTQLAEVPGVNPIVFDHLEDYAEYLEWERHHGRRCPVLYLQQGIDTQGNPVYIDRPEFEANMKLLDASRDDPPYNRNGFPGFDPENLYVGEDTPLDEMHKPPLIDPDPMPGQ